ncbi:uncharacterized protein V1518DRAFT_415220 [Limtongia smithiae]|uniref:uncharacterized protein n=1 Tax=Limtongia smithiae TaxID=1125753 RepID=UPI0034CE5B87
MSHPSSTPEASISTTAPSLSPDDRRRRSDDFLNTNSTFSVPPRRSFDHLSDRIASSTALQLTTHDTSDTSAATSVTKPIGPPQLTPAPEVTSLRRSQRKERSTGSSGSDDWNKTPVSAGRSSGSGSSSSHHYSSPVISSNHTESGLTKRPQQHVSPSSHKHAPQLQSNDVYSKKAAASSSSSFMSGLFHLGRSKKHDASVSPAKAHGGKISPGGAQMYNRHNYSEPHLGPIAQTHTPSTRDMPATQSRPLHPAHSHQSLRPPQGPPSLQTKATEQSVRKQPSTAMISSVGPRTSSTSHTNTHEPVIRSAKASSDSKPPPSRRKSKILVLCTTDHEHFVLVNIASCSDADAVKTAVLEKMRINAPTAQVYLTDLGEQERGDPLNDEQLLSECSRGDSRGTLKLFFRPSGKHYMSAPNILTSQAETRQTAGLAPRTSSIPAGGRTAQPTGQQQSLRSSAPRASFQGSSDTDSMEVAANRRPSQARGSNREEPDESFKVLPPPRVLLDFNRGRESPYSPFQMVSNTGQVQPLTALRKPPPPPPGRHPSLSSASGRRQSQTPRGDSLTNLATEHGMDSRKPSISDLHDEIGTNSSDWKFESDTGSLLISPRTTFKPRGNSPQPSAQGPNKIPRKPVDFNPDSWPVPLSSEETGPNDESFAENEVSFADAPAFQSMSNTSDSDDDDDDDDGGLWAKRPPSEDASLVDNPSDQNSLPLSFLETWSESSQGADSRQNSLKAKRPVLHVQTDQTKVAEQPTAGAAMSSITELTESTAHSTPAPVDFSIQPSPMSVVGDLPQITSHHSRSPLETKQPTPSPGAYDYNIGEGWAVRPPAEVVYSNLEKYFPNTDLDKPIIDDNAPYSPSSPLLENGAPQAGTGSSALSRVPLSTTVEIATPITEEDLSATSQSTGGADLDRGFSFKSSLHEGGDVEKLDVQPAAVAAAAANAVISSSNKEHRGATSTSRPPARASRMKSIRVVAKEANDARKSVQKPDNKEMALIRRKSTKVWGHKVVEVTAGQMKKGRFSIRGRGRQQQFTWVKGELIGKGTFGRVYLALNATTGEMIAVKQVDVPQTASDKASEKQREVVTALNAEIETMKDLDHLNIVQYLGYEALPEVCSLFLEYVPGGSIGTCLRKHGRFERPVIHSLTRQVVDGLAYLHSKGILHRDLKSDNLLLDLDGICKISDFGISKRSQNIYSNDAAMSMQGTIFWMAPEVIHNVIHHENEGYVKQGYSAKVDIWSLGCVVLEMFAGRRPWSNDEAIGAMYKLGNAKLAPPIPEDTKDYICDEGKQFLSDCFKVNPEQRPTAQVLLMSRFCVKDELFKFADTNLARLIKYNDKRKEQGQFTVQG